MNKRKLATVGILWATAMVTAIGLVSILTPGCNQETKTGVTQVPDQRTITQPESRQYDKTTGHVFYINTCNVPTPTTQPAVVQTGGAIAKIEGTKVDAANNAGGLASDGKYVVYQQNVFNIGNNESTKTGAATGTSEASLTPSQNANANPVQTVEPVAAVTVPVGLPGSAVSGQSNVAGRGANTAGQTQSPTQMPTYTPLTLTGTPDQINQYANFLKSILDAIAGKISEQKAATSQTSE